MNNQLLGLLMLSATTISMMGMQQDAPIAKNAIVFAHGHRIISGDLSPLVSGGQEPYLFLPKQGANGQVGFYEGKSIFTFEFDENATEPGTFTYLVVSISKRWIFSNEATVTIYPRVSRCLRTLKR